MGGNTRQGLKCRLCRMNVHGECQDRVVKCTPKAKFSRMKSTGSELGDDERMSARGSLGPDQKRFNFVNSKPASQESQLLTPPTNPSLARPHPSGGRWAA